MNGQTPFLLPWPAALPFQLQAGQLGKFAGLQQLQQAAMAAAASTVQPLQQQHQQQQQQHAAAIAAAAFPYGQYAPFTTITIPGGHLYLPNLSLPPTAAHQLLTAAHSNVGVTSLPKLIMPTIKVIQGSFMYRTVRTVFCTFQW